MSSEYSTPSKQKSKWKIHLSTSAKENPFGQTPYTPLLIAKSPRVRPFQEEQLSPPKERSTEISTESPIKLRDELLCHRGGAEEVRRLVKESNIFPKKGKGVLVPIIPKVLCHRRAQTETFILGESKQLSDKEGSTLPDIPYLHSFSVRKCLLDTSSTCINPRLLQMTAGKYPPRKVRLTPSPNLMAKYQNPMKTRFKVNTTQLIRKQERQLELDQIIIQNKGSVVRYHKEGDEPNIQEFNRIHSKNRLEEYSNTYSKKQSMRRRLENEGYRSNQGHVDGANIFKNQALKRINKSKAKQRLLNPKLVKSKQIFDSFKYLLSLYSEAHMKYI